MFSKNDNHPISVSIVENGYYLKDDDDIESKSNFISKPSFLNSMPKILMEQDL